MKDREGHLSLENYSNVCLNLKFGKFTFRQFFLIEIRVTRCWVKVKTINIVHARTKLIMLTKIQVFQVSATFFLYALIS